DGWAAAGLQVDAVHPLSDSAGPGPLRGHAAPSPGRAKAEGCRARGATGQQGGCEEQAGMTLLGGGDARPRVSRRLPLASTGNIARRLLEAVEALAEAGDQLVESLRFDGVLDLVIEPVAAEAALDDGHRERAPAGADDGLKRRDRSLGHDLAREDLAAR